MELLKKEHAFILVIDIDGNYWAKYPLTNDIGYQIYLAVSHSPAEKRILASYVARATSQSVSDLVNQKITILPNQTIIFDEDSYPRVEPRGYEEMSPNFNFPQMIADALKNLNKHEINFQEGALILLGTLNNKMGSQLLDLAIQYTIEALSSSQGGFGIEITPQEKQRELGPTGISISMNEKGDEFLMTVDLSPSIAIVHDPQAEFEFQIKRMFLKLAIAESLETATALAEMDTIVIVEEPPEYEPPTPKDEESRIYA